MQNPRFFWNSLAKRFARRQSGLEAIGIPGGGCINNYLDYATRKAIFCICKKIKISGATVLDVGCGIGRVTVFFANSAGFVVGLDISEEMIRRAKELTHSRRNKIQYVVASSHDMPFRTEAFDIVNCVAVLQHIKDNKLFDKSLQEFSRVLKKQAHAIVVEFVPTKIDLSQNDAPQLDPTTFPRPLAYFLSRLKPNALSPVWKRGVTTYLFIDFIARAAATFKKGLLQKPETPLPRDIKFLSLRLVSDAVLITATLLLMVVDTLVFRIRPKFFYEHSSYKAFILSKG